MYIQNKKNVGDVMLKKEDLAYVEKRVEERVEEGILNYHVLESMADWVRVIDKKGNIIYANKTMKDELGHDIVGKKCFTSYGQTDYCNFCITERTITTGEIVQKEQKVFGKHFSIKSSPVTNSKGEIYAAVEVFRDVSRERKLELELIERNKKMRTDLGFARRIQEKILPNKGKLYNLSIDYVYDPSEMLSGDMFDIFPIDSEHLGMYISDVSGHGVAASMTTMFIRQTMRSIRDDILNPGEALRELHKRFKDLDLEVDKYFTMFYGVFNKSTYEFKYANAGHNCVPVKFNHNSIEQLKVKGFPIMLFFDDIEYEEKSLYLEKKDKLLFYTDGITEMKNRDGLEFGVDGVINLIEDKKDITLSQIEETIINYSWAEQEDDVAIVLVEVDK